MKGIKFGSILLDGKVRGINVAFTMKIGDYWEISKTIVKKNPFQRGRVRRGQNVYALLQEDLIEGCIMLPIILATDDKFRDGHSREMEIIKGIVESGNIDTQDKKNIRSIVRKALRKKQLYILDGLQRTDTIDRALREESERNKRIIKTNEIRAEIE